jgi:hypothetical protein
MRGRLEHDGFHVDPDSITLARIEERFAMAQRGPDEAYDYMAWLIARVHELEAKLEGKPPIIREVTMIGKDEPELDEVIAQNASVHLEAMADNHWWMLIQAGGKDVHVNLSTKRAKISAFAEED